MSLVKKFRIYSKNLTLKRMWNYFLVHLSLKLKRPKVWGKPLSLFIEPTNICNAKCCLCPRGNGKLTKKQGVMGIKEYKKLLDELGDTAFSVTLWNYGEPFLNKNLIQMIKLAKKKGLKVITSTNGVAFRDMDNVKKIIDSGLDELIVAIDGVDEKTYLKYRGNCDFNANLKGLKLLAKEKGDRYFPFVSMQFIVMKQNEDQIEDIKKLAKELGVNELILKTVFLFGNEDRAKEFLPNEKYSRYRIVDGKLSYKKNIVNGCDGLWVGASINYDGNVVPCCFDAFEHFKFGNVSDGGFMSVWNNEKFVAFRTQILRDKMRIKLCSDCPSNMESMDVDRISFH
ncbi:radical SAM protein [archaeon]|jgi:radical SAM protein with 4Fe4S-binding SPASM domain|nr:radical SAM protein [archaeon]MBT4416985.1 radical SAM protein [archaeon]